MIVGCDGRNRYKIGLHIHTTVSDGRKSPEQAISIYKQAGYDAIAFTDHWAHGYTREESGMLILAGCEYNTPTGNGANGVYHILSIGAESTPELASKKVSAQEIVDAIHAANGLAVLAHPSWSINTPDHITSVHGFDATEIYNRVSGVHNSRRAYSGDVVDMLACKGIDFPLLATDDTHYYDGTDETNAWIMVEADELSKDAIISAIKAKNFYATQGPELCVTRDGNSIHIKCSPVKEIVVFSNLVWVDGHAVEGEALTSHTYSIKNGETFIRIEVRDKNGKSAWSNILFL